MIHLSWLLLTWMTLTQGSSRQIEAWLKQSDAAYRTGRLDESLALIQKACGADPSSAPLQSLLARRAQEAGRLDLALSAARSASELAPKDGNALWMLGVIAHEKKRHQESLDSLDRAASLLKEQPGLHQARGLALLSLQRFGEAVKAFQRAVEMDANNAEYHYLSGLAQSYLPGRPGQPNDQADRAGASFEKALSLEPRHALANYHYGRWLVERGNLDAAIPRLELALKVKPEMTGAYFTLGNALMRQGKTKEGRDHLLTFSKLEKAQRESEVMTRLLELRPADVDLRVRRVRADLARGELKRALDDLSAITVNAPDRHDGWILFAKLELRRSRPKSALDKIGQALSLAPTSREARTVRIQAWLQRRLYKKARPEIVSLIEEDDQDAAMHALHADALEGLGELQAAREARARAAELKKGSGS